MSTIFHLIFYNPLYNLLVWLSVVLPGHSFGLAVIALTLVVKFLLLPLSRKASLTQRAMNELEIPLAKLKEQHKDNREEQARQIMALYKSRGVNPLASLWIVVIQIPIVLALFWIVRQGVTINHDILYSFIAPPTVVDPKLFIFDLTERNYFLAILTGVTQWVQMYFALPKLVPNPNEKGVSSFKNDFAKTMHFQMRYVMPVFVVVAASSLPSAVAVYWITSNIFATVQELWMKQSKNSPLDQTSNPANPPLS